VAEPELASRREDADTDSREGNKEYESKEREEKNKEDNESKGILALLLFWFCFFRFLFRCDFSNKRAWFGYLLFILNFLCELEGESAIYIY
jgi:hypothetical protein